MVDEINQQFVADQEQLLRNRGDAADIRRLAAMIPSTTMSTALQRAADILDPPPPPPPPSPPPLAPITREYPHFYMVWTKTGTWPRFMHANEWAAVAEAERLARKHPGKKFIVLHAWLKLSVAEQQEKSK